MREKGIGSIIKDNVNIQGDICIGNYSILGENATSNSVLNIADSVKIGSFCILYGGSNIGRLTEIDDYCAIYYNAEIGDKTKLLYGKKIYSNAVIGDECIIGGNIPERMQLGNRVTFMGEVAHSHYNPKNDWDTTDEPSPKIGDGSIIGVNALLIGGVVIGKNCYISAGEILRHDLEDNSVYLKGQIYPISKFKGLLNTRY